MLKTLQPSKESRGFFDLRRVFLKKSREIDSEPFLNIRIRLIARPARGEERSQAGENVYDVNATCSRIYSRFSRIRAETDRRNEGATNWWRRVNQRKDDDCPIAVYRGIDMATMALFRSGGDRENRGGRSTFRRIEGDHVRAGSSGLGRLGLGLVALCLVEAVDQRLDDELDRQLVDVLHVLRISVLQCTLHRVQKRFLDFLQVERIWLLQWYTKLRSNVSKIPKEKSNVTILIESIIPQTFNHDNSIRRYISSEKFLEYNLIQG